MFRRGLLFCNRIWVYTKENYFFLMSEHNKRPPREASNARAIDIREFQKFAAEQRGESPKTEALTVGLAQDKRRGERQLEQQKREEIIQEIESLGEQHFSRQSDLMDDIARRLQEQGLPHDSTNVSLLFQKLPDSYRTALRNTEAASYRRAIEALSPSPEEVARRLSAIGGIDGLEQRIRAAIAAHPDELPHDVYVHTMHTLGIPIAVGGPQDEIARRIGELKLHSPFSVAELRAHQQEQRRQQQQSFQRTAPMPRQPVSPPSEKQKPWWKFWT